MCIENVTVACPFSKFKDDRHEWHLVMYEQNTLRHNSALYALRRCNQCKLTVLLVEHGGSFESAPKKDDLIIFAFYPQGAF